VVFLSATTTQEVPVNLARVLSTSALSSLAWRRARGRDIRHAAEGLLLHVTIGAFWLLPVDTASAIGGFIGRTLGPRLRVSRRARENLIQALPANDAAENKRILRAMWDNLGRTAAEYAHLSRICADGSGRIDVVGGEIIAALGTGSRPCIFFGGHFANWEVGPFTLRRLLGVPLASVYRAANNPWVDRLILRLRRASVSIPKGGKGGRELLCWLKSGGHVGILVDQKLNDGIAVPFFGRDAMTAPAVARFGLKFGCPLVPVAAERLGGAHFRVTVLPPLVPIVTGDTPRDVLAIMTAVNAEIEAWVRRRPDQWLWVHRRWPD
jgi:Kdo2-lipid IVA lauroyltransferase/acyltransferase